MKKLEKLKKKELIEYITTIRPKADAYDRVCKQLGIENNILGFVETLNMPIVIKSINNDNPILKKRLEDCGFSTRLISIFDSHEALEGIDGKKEWKRRPLQTVEELVFYSKRHFQKERGCGTGSINEILDFMEKHNLIFENNN